MPGLSQLDELARVLDECLSDPDVKVIIFSEWEGMLKKVRDWADKKQKVARLLIDSDLAEEAEPHQQAAAKALAQADAIETHQE